MQDVLKLPHEPTQVRPRILFFVPADYQALVQKGVTEMILDRNEGDFFDLVVTIHPFASTTRIIKLNDRNILYEFGFKNLPILKQGKFSKYIQAPFQFFRVLKNTLKIAKDYKINMIRANDPYWMGVWAYISSRILSIPFCVSIHADHEKRHELDRNISMSKVFGSTYLSELLESFIYKQSNLVLPIRESLKKKIVGRNIQAEKVMVIPHGIDLNIFDAPYTGNLLDKLPFVGERKVISFVGRLSKENYIDDIIQAVEILLVRRSDFVLVIAGGGIEEKALKEKISLSPLLKKHVFFAGFLPRKECYEVRKISYLSLCLMGGFSLIEACAAARPVIAYDVEWHYELVNSSTGFLLKEKDIEGIVKSLDYIFDHPQEAESMGMQARLLIENNHTKTLSEQLKINAYSKLLASQ